MENYAMTNFEEMVADEMFPETNDIYESENFPTKDRSKSATRRKKTYFKGKKRFDRLCDFALEPLFRNPRLIGGMLRKTNIIRPTLERNSGVYRFNDRCTVRRLDAANNKLTEFGFEGAEEPLIVREA